MNRMSKEISRKAAEAPKGEALFQPTPDSLVQLEKEEPGKKYRNGKLFFSGDILERKRGSRGKALRDARAASVGKAKKRYVKPMGYEQARGGGGYLACPASQWSLDGELDRQDRAERAQYGLPEPSFYGTEAITGVENMHHAPELSEKNILRDEMPSDHSGRARLLIGWQFLLTAVFWHEILVKLQAKTYLAALWARMTAFLARLWWGTYVASPLARIFGSRALHKKLGWRRWLSWSRRKYLGEAPRREVAWPAAEALKREDGSYWACNVPGRKLNDEGMPLEKVLAAMFFHGDESIPAVAELANRVRSNQTGSVEWAPPVDGEGR